MQIILVIFRSLNLKTMFIEMIYMSEMFCEQIA